MPNRYTRDELIKIALNMAQLPNLERHDMPDGVVLPDAFSIQWLQDILDFWYHMVPFSAAVDKVTLNATAGSDTIVLPSNFVLDVRNGYLTRTDPTDILSLRRRIRTPLQKFITRQLQYQRSESVNFPYFYCVQGIAPVTSRQTMKITPTPTVSTIGQLWYYKLPAPLDSNDIPHFPNDYVCLEYIRIRSLEWARVYDPGTAQKFCDKIVAGMKAAGLMNEPEDDEIPFDEEVYIRQQQVGGYTTYAWMGPR